MSGPEKISTIEAPQISETAEYSLARFEKYGLTEQTLNEYGKTLNVKAQIDFKNTQTIDSFVEEIQNALRSTPSIADQFSDQLNFLSDKKFGPITHKALEIALNQGRTSNLLQGVEQDLNTPSNYAGTTHKAIKTDQATTNDEVNKPPQSPEPLNQSLEINRNKVAFRWGIDKKEGILYKTSCSVKSGEKAWTVGSSSAYGLEKQTGYGSIGAIGSNPQSFYSLFTKHIWPELEKGGIKPPATVILTGMAANGLTDKTNQQSIDKSVQNNLAGYNKLASFLKSKGVSVVKYATINPYGPKIAAISQFNNTLRANPDLCVDTNRAVATSDGLNYKPGYAAGKNALHLTPRGQKDYARTIREAV